MERNQTTAGFNYPYGGNRCPNCGYCPHCGRGSWGGPWWNGSITLCGTGGTTTAGDTNLNNQNNNANTGQ